MNTFSSNKIAMLCSVDVTSYLLNCIIEIIQVTKGHKYVPQGAHVGQA